MASESFEIVRAERTQARLRLALTGSSNAGKTWSSILLAKGICEGLIAAGKLTAPLEGKIGMIDTERKSSTLYADLVPFDVVHLPPPYSADRYAAALATLEGAGYAVIIIDQISHAWAGPGGMLALLSEKAKRSSTGNSFQAWAEVTPEQDAFIDRLLASPAHLIVNMRQKTEWVIEDVAGRDGKMRKTPRRIGTKPIQRDGVEYEFTTLLGLDTDTHLARPLKNRCPVFRDGVGVLLNEAIGRSLAEWMLGGAPLAAEEVQPLTDAQKAESIVSMAEANFPKVPNVPDLARRFATAQEALRNVCKDWDPAAYAPLRDRLVAAKDLQKGALSGKNIAPATDLQQGVSRGDPDALYRMASDLPFN